ncbi:hypothetical protein CEXT_561491 [Caerostris extrusa]|uniref:Uncharacterized protein n=1 Tax=Caerostris extrusa TaxID=172846 RepID=A0AAV4TJZ6_CAEEX|nr:hypothetical protein CEXT_561491 [Caerostris extrusa]
MNIAFGYKNAGTWRSPQIAPEHESLNEGSRSACEALLQERRLCANSFKEIPAVKGYKKAVARCLPRTYRK